MSQWFRLYNETLDDPKVQRLAPELFKGWINLLCLAARHDGTVAEANVAFALRLDDATAAALIVALIEARLFDRNEAGLVPHNWRGRQYQSDFSNRRVKQHRSRHRADDRNGELPLQVTAPETDSESESEPDSDSESNDSPPVAGPVPSRDIDRAVEFWNQVAAENGLTRITRLTGGRRQLLAARLRDGGLDGWKDALLRLEDSPFLLGNRPSAAHPGWRADFDWLIKQKSYTRVREGAFAERGDSA